MSTKRQVYKNIESFEEWMSSETTARFIEEELLLYPHESDWSNGATVIIHNHILSYPQKGRDSIVWTVNSEGSTCISYNNPRHAVRYESTDHNPNKMRDLKRLLTPILTSHPAGHHGVINISPICTKHREFISYIIESIETLAERISDETQPIRRHVGRFFGAGTTYVGDYSYFPVCVRKWDKIDNFDEAHIESDGFTMFIVVH